MNKETYEALKKMVKVGKQWSVPKKIAKNWGIKVSLEDVKLVESWIDEVKKKYED